MMMMGGGWKLHTGENRRADKTRRNKDVDDQSSRKREIVIERERGGGRKL